MNYYVVETDKHKLIQKTAGVKARQDVETIFKWNNLKKIEIPCLIEGRENKTRLGKIKAHYDVYMLWKNALKKIKKNDWIYIQFPYDLYLIDGPGENIKITTPEDFYTMRAILEAKENEQIYGLE